MGSCKEQLRYSSSTVSLHLVEAFCSEVREDVITWPQTSVGETVHSACPIGMIGEVSRECQSDSTWGAVSGSCGSLAENWRCRWRAMCERRRVGCGRCELRLLVALCERPAGPADSCVSSGWHVVGSVQSVR